MYSKETQTPTLAEGTSARCLLVGLGGRSVKRHLPVLRRSGQVELVGAVDVDVDKAGSLGGVAPFFESIDDALAAVHAEVAVVATPHHTHFAIVNRLLGAGVAVLKEKPFALNFDEAWQLVELLDSTGGFLRIAVQRQFNPVFKAVRDLLPRLGTLRHFEAVYHLNAAPYGHTWRGDHARAGGGALIDMGYHTLDLIVSYFGVPRTVSAVEVLGRPGSERLPIEESVAAILEYEDGLVGRVFLSRCETSKREGFTVTGSESGLHATPDSLVHFDAYGTPTEVVSVPTSAGGKGAEMIEEFIATRGDKELLRSETERGLGVMRLTDALYASIQGRTAVLLEQVDTATARMEPIA